MLTDIAKVFIPTTVAFFIGIAITPGLTYYLYRFKVWKKHPGKIALDGREAVEFNKIHKDNEGRTPRMGGIVIWGSTAIVTLGFAILARLAPQTIFQDFDFLTRSQTWVPFATLVIGSLVGLVND